MRDLLPWLALRGLPAGRRRELPGLIERLGSAAAVQRHLRLEDDREAARSELAAARRLGLRMLCFSDPSFPPALRRIPDPPLVLYAKGELPSGLALAMVGSRRATARGLAAAGAFAAELARAEVAVVSGLAYGIDAAAHEGALAGGGLTVAVLASGLDRPSPAGNRRLAERILAGGGGWLSEHPPGIAALPRHFPERNRLISGLASVTVLIEARQASGTLWTARHALEQDRELLVVPGPIDDAHYRGSNRLLRDGAAPALEPADLLMALGLPPRGSARAPATWADPLLRALGEGPCDADRLARLLSLSPAVLSRRLLELELEGRVERRGNRISLSSQR